MLSFFLMFGAYILLFNQTMIRLLYRVGHDSLQGMDWCLCVSSPHWLLVVLLTSYSMKKQCLHQTASFFLNYLDIATL